MEPFASKVKLLICHVTNTLILQSFAYLGKIVSGTFFLVTLVIITHRVSKPNLIPSYLSTSLCEVTLSEVMQVLRGAGKVGSALVTTQGEQLRLMTCNSSVGAAVKVAQDAVEGLVGTFMGSNNAVRIPESISLGSGTCDGHFIISAHEIIN